MRTFTVGLFLGIFISAHASANDWYVDGKNGNGSNSGLSGSPLQTIYQGMAKARPGDTVHVLPTVIYSHFAVSISGTATAPIVIKGEGVYPNMTKVWDTTGFPIMLGTRSGTTYNHANYVHIVNFDVSAMESKYAGIHISENNHHILIEGNHVHNSSNGIGTAQADYITIRKNVVYNNSHYTANNVYGSGISIMSSSDIDSNTGVKILIDSNITYNNTNVLTPGVASGDSDGSGIILDDNLHLQSKDKSPNSAPYRGRIQVSNNISFNNGGRGIHIYQTDHALLINNTLFQNNKDPKEGNYNPGEISVNTAGDIQIYNNILSSDGLHDALDTSGFHRGLNVSNCNDAAGPITADYNLVYNPQNDASLAYFAKQNINFFVYGAHNQFANPMFVNAVLPPNMFDAFDLSQENFRLKTGSPAVGAGNFALGASSDFTGLVRSTPSDLGAYEQSAAVPVETLVVTVVVSGSNYLGSPAFGLLVNGVQMGSTNTVTSLFSIGAWQTFSYKITRPTSFSTIGVQFLNDAYGGSKTADRNLYVQSITVNGKALVPGQGIYKTASGTSAAGQVLMYTNGTLTWNSTLIP